MRHIVRRAAPLHLLSGALHHCIYFFDFIGINYLYGNRGAAERNFNRLTFGRNGVPYKRVTKRNISF